MCRQLALSLNCSPHIDTGTNFSALCVELPLDLPTITDRIMKITTFAALIALVASQASGAVILDILGNTDSDNPGVVEWTFTDLGDSPPSFSSVNDLTPGISGSFTPGFTGSLVIDVEPFTTYDPVTNTGTLSGNGLISNNSGLGINGGQNGGINAGEFVVFTVDLSGVSPSALLNLVALTGTSTADEVFLNGASIGASSSISNLNLSDGDIVAFTFGESGTGSTRITELTIDLVADSVVIPEPATTALLGLIGIAAVVRRGR